MSQQRRSGEKIIHVDKLVIHAKKVEIINEGHEREHEDGHEQRPSRRRDPWGFFWGRQQQMDESSSSSSSSEDFSDDRDGMERES